ncbi:peroxisomal membrane protein pmp34-related [Holotrichia oblita]|uniref:Peroxisomal membrane protein pmp34-related n=1 Tax=Holotrichia oblita TaxID=644536 RepID=A0ACB9TPB2_HOLOL|nr:peroxisomal membrane protein pmp34-related [Holotrichia oblita]
MSKETVFNYETLVHAVAGSAGSIFAMTIFYPLDTIRFRLQCKLEDNNEKGLNTFQVFWKILRNEGVEALYRGLKPVLLSLGASNFVYFYAFHGLKSIQKNSTTTDLKLGIIAGIINVLVTAPLWVVNSRLKIEEQKYYTGLLDGLVHIANTEGLAALWSGVGSSLVLVSNPAIQFAVYEALKRQIPAKSASAFFLMGALAKAVATMATYPIQLAQSRQRNGKNRMNTLVLLYALLKRKGPRALFSGLEAKLYQTVLTAALMFVTYEKIVRFVFIIFLRSHRKKLSV